MNPAKLLALKIFLGCEIIVALRLLLFEIPVLINKFLTSGDASLSSMDTFLLLVAVIGICYLVAGIVSFLGNPSWRMLHYMVVIVTLALASGFYVLSSGRQEAFVPCYALPIVVAAVTLVMALMFRDVHSVRS